MKLNVVVKFGATAFFASMLLSGCASSIQNLGKSSNFQEAKKAHTKKEFVQVYKKYKEDNKTDDLLWNYEVGTVGCYIDNYKDSINYFDNAENLIKKYDEEVMASKLLANVGSLLTNDTFMDYRPRIYEKIMVNTYKGLDFILLGDFQNARIEFNRALVRQDRAKDFFQKEIELKKKEIEKEIEKESESELKKKGKKVNQSSMNSIVENKKTNDVIEKKYSNLFAFKPYPDFVNPFTTYLAGIYFLNIGDYSKATDLLKECYGMVKGLDNGDKYVLDDFKLADRMKSSIRKRDEHYTWVIFLNGEGPIKKELRINVPLFLVTNSKKVRYTGIALPTLKMRQTAYTNLIILNGKEKRETKKFASMDRVVKTEFKNRFPLVVARALTRTVVQTIMQKQLQDKVGNLGGILGALYQGVMNRADTRIWERLPKEFQVARVKTSKYLTIFAGNKRVYKLDTDPNRNYIVFVTIPDRFCEPIVQYQKF